MTGQEGDGGREVRVAYDLPSAAVRVVDLDRPWSWLARGFQDLRRAPEVGFIYGLVFTAVGYTLAFGLYAADQVFLILPLGGGFLLVAPMLAVGLYRVSATLEAGGKPSVVEALSAWRPVIGQLAVLAFVLVFAYLIWLRIAFLIFMLFFGLRSPAPETFFNEVFLQPESVPFLVIGTGSGAILALFVFSISAVSIPMILDRNASVLTAIVTSVRAVLANPGPMLLWAALIVVFTAAGLASLFIGLVVMLPLIGHATWHAYRDLVV
jgi:uncharacterized membrane protein